MAMTGCAYSCVIDAITAAVIKAEIRAPMFGQWTLRGDSRLRADDDQPFVAYGRVQIVQFSVGGCSAHFSRLGSSFLLAT